MSARRVTPLIVNITESDYNAQTEFKKAEDIQIDAEILDKQVVDYDTIKQRYTSSKIGEKVRQEYRLLSNNIQ